MNNNIKVRFGYIPSNSKNKSFIGNGYLGIRRHYDTL